MHDTSVKMLSLAHTALFRLTGGIIGSRLVNNDMLLLTTTGAASGDPHTVPLLYLRDEDDLIIIASYGGRPHHPDWYHNLVNDPTTSIQIGSRRTAFVAEPMSDAEHDRWWPRIVDAYRDYAVYQSRTDRKIPVIRLTPADRELRTSDGDGP